MRSARISLTLAMLASAAISVRPAVSQGAVADALATAAAAGSVEDTAYRVRFTVTGQGAWPAAAVVSVVFNRKAPDSGTVLTLKPGEARLTRIAGGRAAAPVTAPFTPSLPADVCLKRDRWVTAVIVNGMPLLRGHDGEPNGGEIAVAASEPALTCQDVLIQPFTEVNLASNFMTDEPTPTGWEVPVGAFETTGLHHVAAPEQYNRPPPDPKLAANPFAYAVKSAAESITTTGYWFWDGCDMRAAVRPMSAGEIGLCAYYQDPQNYLLFHWAQEGAGNERRLTLVRNGAQQELAAAPGGFQQMQWYQLGLQVYDGYAEATIDGQTVLTGRADAFLMGEVGLYGRDAESSVYDDVAVHSWRRVADDFQQFEEGKWVANQGKWEYGNGSIKATRSAGGAGVVYGDRTWHDYEVRCRVTPARNAKAIGIYLNYQDPENHYVFRWNGESAEPARRWKRELIRVSGGEATTVAQSFGGDPGGQPHEVTASVHDGVVRLDVDGQVAASAGDSSSAEGRVGFLVEDGDGTRFDQLVALFYPPPAPAPAVTQQFTQEATMSGWASAGGLWSAPAGAPPVRWFEGVCYGDARIEAHVNGARSQQGKLTLVLNGDRNAANSGYGMTFELQGANGVSGRLSRRGQPEAIAKLRAWPQEDEQQVFRFQRRGKQLAAYVDDQCITSLRDETPIEHQDVGVAMEGVSLNLEDVSVWAPHMLEYTFSEAPVDWFHSSGAWEVADRWQCFPGWAWLCGYMDPVPTLWSKRTFTGDQVIELYCAMKMDLPDGPGYDRPSDLNVTICGDGARRDSGYSLIFAGWNPGRDQWPQAKSALLRGDTIVAERPDVKFNQPTSGNMDFHRHWFYIRMEKHGDRVAVSIDDQKVFDYQDPNPLAGGRVAFWTYKNGIMLARVRVSHEEGGEVTLFPPSNADGKRDIPFSLYE